MSEFECQVVTIEPLTANVQRILLRPENAPDFKAGQYIRVVMDEGDKRPFSIANAPDESGLIELHIGAAEHNPWAMQVIEKMQSAPGIMLDGPHGNAFLRNDRPHPTILMAGGTGFSYTWSILQQLLRSPLKEPLFLYWGTRTQDDMYALQELEELAQQHSKFRFIPVLENPDSDWQGRSGLVHQAVLEDFVSLEPYQVYIAGRFEMAGAAREDFHNQGLMLENLFGDAYDFI
ncbi:NAD(P)H-flavin reductase [Lacimicrobium alkaliphilum]|uniref:NAD(P)H-flavin reductase n=1 Tax=Lacimicrobium alkaliphilum TaxID=1526571 RepID=A0A0U2ZEV2_9ALTE|nr:NAD(P)H-flavin reductase [Lacimicrobium alkaliphilum]ALS96956.1 NAD(P)H-flavin reductase [Lacimicrobium alkaliphilum]